MVLLLVELPSVKTPVKREDFTHPSPRPIACRPPLDLTPTSSVTQACLVHLADSVPQTRSGTLAELAPADDTDFVAGLWRSQTFLPVWHSGVRKKKTNSKQKVEFEFFYNVLC